MNYKKKNGKRRKARLNGFRYLNVHKALGHGENWRHGGIIRRHVRASMAVEECE